MSLWPTRSTRCRRSHVRDSPRLFDFVAAVAGHRHRPRRCIPDGQWVFLEQPDVVANPAAFRLRLAFRRRQSDTLPDLASFNAVLEIEPDETVGGVPVAIIATFDVDPITTQNLPANGCVYRVEWTDAIGQSPRRVLQGHVRAED